MTLPTPNEIKWSEWKQGYKIDTPTFRLTPIEKPDMSPFLVHMTGKNEILNILKGVGAPKETPKGYGYLQANVPESNSEVFEAKVVCLTESPTFALDFFRYRSFRRWAADQRYGIGFDKTKLVQRGARPVIYADDQLVGILNAVFQSLKEKDKKLSDDSQLNDRLIKTVKKIYPLLFPLREKDEYQGFMWEREWRYPDEKGFVFGHQDIKVICCPQSEEDKIRQILGDTAGKIQFIRAWQEYDDVTDYLTRQQLKWKMQAQRVEKPKTQDEAIQQLEDKIQQYKNAVNSLSSYQAIISRLSGEVDRVVQEKIKLNKRASALQEQLDAMRQEKRTQRSKSK
jgi:hypothetical protein